MAMQTDVKAKELAATAASGVGACRIKSVYISATAAGTVSIKNGGASGAELILLDTAGTASNTNVLFPGEGVLFSGDPYVTLSANVKCTFFYG